MLFLSVLAVSALAVTVSAQNCGPSYSNQTCASGNCCSQYGWCDTDAAHCDPATCLSKYSGPGSSCANLLVSSSDSKYAATTTTAKTSLATTGKTTSKASSKISSVTSSKSSSKSSSKTSSKPSSSTPSKSASSSTSISPYASTVPDIDVCGSASNNISCPGAGINGYFYRCCSTVGHCGPKNNIQDQNLYCGSGCQAGFGKCDNESAPPNPTGTPGVAQAGDTCGPIVNAKCVDGLCCSGSNYCGNTTDFCGAANWCQAQFGRCD